MEKLVALHTFQKFVAEIGVGMADVMMIAGSVGVSVSMISFTIIVRFSGKIILQMVLPVNDILVVT